MGSKDFGYNSNTLFKVETNYPNSEDNDEKFTCYNASAYTDFRDPGNGYDKMLINTQKELFDRRSSSQYGGHSEILSFKNLEDAIAVAQFLEKYGRISSGWDKSMEEKYQKRYRGPLKVRVIQETITVNRLNVEYEHYTPPTAYELELAALKKRYGINDGP